MASNFFTRSKGLHPTPSACFPPRKPCKERPVHCVIDVLQWSLTNPVAPINAGSTIAVQLWNHCYPVDQPFTYLWTPEEMTGPFPGNGMNNRVDQFEGERTEVTGHFRIFLVAFWPNGSNVHLVLDYTTLPPK